MDKISAEMFAKQPDEIIGGDYFYHNPREDGFAEVLKLAGTTLEKYHEKVEERIKRDFKRYWETRTLKDKFDPLRDGYLLENIEWETNNEEFKEIIYKIARDNKPVLDIASSESMGVIPYIIKINSQLPCLVTDLDSFAMKGLRSYIHENSMEYNINIASFDNNDIPIKADSLDYVTSINGATSSRSLGKTDKTKKYGYPYQFSTGSEKVINEIYRILKPGGCFVTLEFNTECDIDPHKIYNDYNEHGKLFGIYTYDEIQAVLVQLKEEPWRDKFIRGGFQVEIEKKFSHKYSIDKIKKFLYCYTHLNGIRKWTDEEISLNYISKEIVGYINSARTIEEFKRNNAAFYNKATSKNSR